MHITISPRKTLVFLLATIGVQLIAAAVHENLAVDVKTTLGTSG